MLQIIYIIMFSRVLNLMDILQIGLKQGCTLSPLFFNMFIHDLVYDIKKLNIGIDVNNEKNVFYYMQILLYL